MKKLQITSVRNDLKSSEFDASDRRVAKTRDGRRNVEMTPAQAHSIGEFRGGENQCQERDHGEQE